MPPSENPKKLPTAPRRPLATALTPLKIGCSTIALNSLPNSEIVPLSPAIASRSFSSQVIWGSAASVLPLSSPFISSDEAALPPITDIGTPKILAIGAIIVPSIFLKGAGRNAPNTLPIPPIAVMTPAPNALNGSIMSIPNALASFMVRRSCFAISSCRLNVPPDAILGLTILAVWNFPPAALPDLLFSLSTSSVLGAKNFSTAVSAFSPRKNGANITWIPIPRILLISGRCGSTKSSIPFITAPSASKNPPNASLIGAITLLKTSPTMPKNLWMGAKIGSRNPPIALPTLPPTNPPATPPIIPPRGPPNLLPIFSPIRAPAPVPTPAPTASP